jgi:hypothetical protein
VTAFSDERLKTNMRPIEDALELVMQLDGILFTRVTDGVEGIGLRAQQVQKLIPQAVSVHDDGYLSVAYGNLVGLLVEAIKTQQAQIEELKQAIRK